MCCATLKAILQSGLSGWKPQDRIYLLNEYFGQGLGQRLLKHNVRLAKQNNQAGLWLFTWMGNTRAVSFYLKQGFEIIGEHMFKVTATHSNPNHHIFLKC